MKTPFKTEGEIQTLFRENKRDYLPLADYTARTHEVIQAKET